MGKKQSTKKHGPARVTMPESSVLQRKPLKKAGCCSMLCGNPSPWRTYTKSNKLQDKIKRFAHEFRGQPGHKIEMDKLALVTYTLSKQTPVRTAGPPPTWQAEQRRKAG